MPMLPWRFGLGAGRSIRIGIATTTLNNRQLTLDMTGGGAEGSGGILPLEAFMSSVTGSARLIGIDVGTKTLGLALSDVERTIASGIVTLRRRKLAEDLRSLLDIAEEEGVGGFVIGLPLNLDGSSGPRAQATRAFARNLAKTTNLPILFWDERLSTAAAERSLLEADASRRRRAEVIDKVSAVWILQGALDRMRRGSLTRSW
jgi:putative Holliday junction resolvase